MQNEIGTQTNTKIRLKWRWIIHCPHPPPHLNFRITFSRPNKIKIWKFQVNCKNLSPAFSESKYFIAIIDARRVRRFSPLPRRDFHREPLSSAYAITSFESKLITSLRDSRRNSISHSWHEGMQLMILPTADLLGSHSIYLHFAVSREGIIKYDFEDYLKMRGNCAEVLAAKNIKKIFFVKTQRERFSLGFEPYHSRHHNFKVEMYHSVIIIPCTEVT